MQILHRYTGKVLKEIEGDSLINADLSGADLRSANLSGADLRSAKQRVFRIDGSRHQITAIDDDVCIGCICMSLADWLEQFETVGSREGYSPVEIAEYEAHLKHLVAVLKINPAVKP